MQNRANDLYEVLGISPTLDLNIIRNAYKKRVIEVHPDKNGGSDLAFNEVQEAYEFLRDSKQCTSYYKNHPAVSDEDKYQIRNLHSDLTVHAGREEALIVALPEEHAGYMSVYIPVYTPAHFEMDTGREQEMQSTPQDGNAIDPMRFVYADQFDYQWLAVRMNQTLSANELVVAVDTNEADKVFADQMQNKKLFYYAEVLVKPAAIQMSDDGTLTLKQGSAIQAEHICAIKESVSFMNSRFLSSFHNNFVATQGRRPFAESTYEMYAKSRDEKAWLEILRFVQDKDFWNPITSSRSTPSGVGQMKDLLVDAFKLKQKTSRTGLFTSYIDSNKLANLATKQLGKDSANRNPITKKFYELVRDHAKNPSQIVSWIGNQYAARREQQQRMMI